MGGGSFTEKNSLRSAEQTLPATHFARCNNCYLVNLGYVRGIDKNDLLIGDERLQISRNRKKEFLNALTRYLGRSR